VEQRAAECDFGCGADEVAARQGELAGEFERGWLAHRRLAGRVMLLEV
jgi:hypothetical protein